MTRPGERDTSEYPVATQAARLARRARYEARAARARSARRVAVSLLAAFTVLAAGWWFWSASGLAYSGNAHLTRTTADSGFELTATQGPPTPVFAYYQDVELNLVVSEEDLTEIGFHRASGDRALPMVSLLPDADLNAADGSNGTGRVPAEVDPDSLERRVLGGSVLRMWRSSRPGPPDNAVDIGAAPGSTVYAPVSGTVIAVKQYELYGKCDDLELHIRPAGRNDIDVVMIHISDVSVRVGDAVTAGVTPVAKVRKLSDRIDHQLGWYSTDAGDHVHMQLNRIEAPALTKTVDAQ